jgi:hypothetical protein
MNSSSSEKEYLLPVFSGTDFFFNGFPPVEASVTRAKMPSNSTITKTLNNLPAISVG